MFLGALCQEAVPGSREGCGHTSQPLCVTSPFPGWVSDFLCVKQEVLVWLVSEPTGVCRTRSSRSRAQTMGRLTASQTGRGMAALSQGLDPPHPIHPPTWQPRYHLAQGWTHEQEHPSTKTWSNWRHRTSVELCLEPWTKSQGSPLLPCF